MRRSICTFLAIMVSMTCTLPVLAQQGSEPRLRKLSVPASQTRTIATALSMQYRDVPGVRIAPDVIPQHWHGDCVFLGTYGGLLNPT